MKIFSLFLAKMKNRSLKIRLLVVFLFLFLFCVTLFAQNRTTSPFFYSLNYRTGENKPHREVIKNLTYPYRGVDLKLGWQTIGNRDWQVAYRYPSLGVGLNWNTFKTDILGDPVAAYFFVNFPQVSTSWFRIDLEANLGLAYGIHPFNKYTNPNNMSTGSSFNAYIAFYLEQSFHVLPEFDVFVSEGLAHYSNGAMGWPNLGLNIPSLKFGVRQYLGQAEKRNKGKTFDFDRNFQIVTNLCGGIRRFSPIEYSGDRIYTYHEALLAPSLFYRIGYKRRLGVGFELAYNEAKQEAIWWEPALTDKELITCAVNCSHEFLINRFTILTQFGVYLSESPTDKWYYERIGFGYYVCNNLRALLNLKAHYIKAEYIEFGISYDLNLN